MNSIPTLIAVMGETASGKSDVAEALAERIDAQLINADAFQVYRGMDIGTAKPLAVARYRLLDLVDPNQPFGLGEWLRCAEIELNTLWSGARSAVVVGGTGLYIRALFEQYDRLKPAPDPELRLELERRERSEGLESLAIELARRAPEVASATDLRNPVRVRRALERLDSDGPAVTVSLPPFRKLKFAMPHFAATFEARIEARIEKMVQNGWAQEVTRLHEQGYRPTDPGFRAIGYRSMWDHVNGLCSIEATKTAAILETRQYAKRQRTWLRKEPRLRTIQSTYVGQALTEILAALKD